MKITIQITELDGNFCEGFLSEKYRRELENKISENVTAEFGDASVSVDVELVRNCSGVRPEPNVNTTPDDGAVYRRVMEIIEFTRETFGAECMQDADFYE